MPSYIEMAGNPRLPMLGNGAHMNQAEDNSDKPEDTLVEDVQVIPLEVGSIISKSRYDGWSKGKKNFTRVALKVLTDIYDKKSRALLSGTNDDGAENSRGDDANNVPGASETETNVEERDPQAMSDEQPKRLAKRPKVVKTTAEVGRRSESPPRSPFSQTTRKKCSHGKAKLSTCNREGKQSAAEAPTGNAVMSTEAPKKILRRRATSQSLVLHPEHKKSESSVRRNTNLASVIGMVAFRKIYMSKLKALTSESKDSHGGHEEDMKKVSSAMPEADEILPVTPRFSAKLSPEAQFAVLKGYEDKLIIGLRTAFPDLQKTMVRVKTPPYAKSLSITCTGRPVQKGASRTKTTHEMNDSSQKTVQLDRYERKVQEYTVQRRVTGQVETAVDILDHLRGSTSGGYHAISPRLRIGRKLEPVPTYNAWTHQWAQQFKVGRNRFE